MIARDDVVTFDHLDGYRTLQSFGFVSSAASRQRNRLRSTFRSLGMLIGLAAGEFLGDAEQLRGEALEALRASADRLGANAVVGLRYDASEVVSKMSATEVLCYGTAVVIKPES